MLVSMSSLAVEKKIGHNFINIFYFVKNITFDTPAGHLFRGTDNHN